MPHSTRCFCARPMASEVPLSEVVTLRQERGFSRLRREDGAREVAVTAEIDEAVTSLVDLLPAIEEGGLADIAERYGLGYRFKGKAEEQAESLADIGAGAIIGLIAIYVVLAWVFASFSRPMIVMAIIPFGFVGAVFGHLLLGFNLTIFSLIGLLGLSGILVNNSIILVRTVDEYLRGRNCPACSDHRRMPRPLAPGTADIADDDRRSDPIDVRTQFSGPIPDTDGDHHRFRTCVCNLDRPGCQFGPSRYRR